MMSQITADELLIDETYRVDLPLDFFNALLGID